MPNIRRKKLGPPCKLNWSIFSCETVVVPKKIPFSVLIKRGGIEPHQLDEALKGLEDAGLIHIDRIDKREMVVYFRMLEPVQGSTHVLL